MFKHVIAAVDGSDGGLDAIALARALAPDPAELTLANIYPRDQLASRASSKEFQAELRGDAERTLAQAREQAGVQANLRSLGAPSVGRGLHELAETIGADLLVVGSSRKGHVWRVLTGDDTRHSLDATTCAIAVAPVGFSTSQAASIGKIGVGYDESPESEEALAFARELAREHDASVAAIEVLYFPARFYVGPAWPDRSTLAQMLAEARERIGRHEGVEPHAATGVPADELATFSQSVDVIVVGSRGYGPLGRVVYGSTARQLARTARCPLLVLPRGAARPESSAAEDAVGATAAAS